nr:MAG TPA: hypothetical protein [Caudoviricetes sp.]
MWIKTRHVLTNKAGKADHLIRTVILILKSA